MKITCNVIKDLLPLYVDYMLSDDSRTIVEEHINYCQECRNYLNEMRSFIEIPADTNTSPLKKIKSALHKKKIQTVIFSVAVSLGFLSILTAFLTSPEYIPYNKNSVTINEIGNGMVLAQFDNTVSGYNIDSYTADDNTGYVYHITAWNSVLNRIFNKSKTGNIILNPNGENVAAVYYCQADGNEDILIYGKDLYPNGGIVTLPRLFLTHYALIAAAFALICALIMIIMRRSKKVFSFATKIFFLPVSYLISHLALKGFTASSFTATRDFFAILLVTIPLYIASLSLLNILSHYKGKNAV